MNQTVESGILSVLSHISDTWLNLIIDGVLSCYWPSGSHGTLSLQLNDVHGGYYMYRVQLSYAISSKELHSDSVLKQRKSVFAESHWNRAVMLVFGVFVNV